MIPKFRSYPLTRNSKGEWQYGHLVKMGKRLLLTEVVEANEQYITIGSWCPVI